VSDVESDVEILRAAFEYFNHHLFDDRHAESEIGICHTGHKCRAVCETVRPFEPCQIFFEKSWWKGITKEVLGGLGHEMCHNAASRGAGHGPEWQQWMRNIELDPFEHKNGWDQRIIPGGLLDVAADKILEAVEKVRADERGSASVVYPPLTPPPQSFPGTYAAAPSKQRLGRRRFDTSECGVLDIFLPPDATPWEKFRYGNWLRAII
jgi:hypothetical protein